MTQGSLAQAAYDRLEALIVSTELRPGARTTLGELERLSGFGRTPVHDAAKRLAAASLLLVQPRSGLRVAPLNFRQEALLLPIRIEMESIACRLAAQRASAAATSRLEAAADKLRSAGPAMTLADFNIVDTELNAAILLASEQSMLGNTLLPLQTLYRRSGWLFLTRLGGPGLLSGVVANHLALLEHVLARNPGAAEAHVRRMLAGVATALARLEDASLDQLVG